jgi:ABC-2 type transport system ATP-binding protein
MLAIDVRDVSRRYVSTTGFLRQRRVVREALREVSLEVPTGELFGLLGPNGAGKTTLVKILSTVLLPTSGSVRILGADVVRDTGTIRQRIGLVFGGERGLYGTLTGRGILEFWADLYKMEPSVAHRRIDEVLGLVGLTDRADERVETYSRGMKQRLHLARGIIHEPELLFLDEPTVGLDPVASREVRAMVRQLNDHGTTIFLTTHDMAEAESLCDRVAFINEGRIALIDKPQALTRAASERVVVELAIAGARVAGFRAELARDVAFELTELPAIDDLAALRVSAPRSLADDLLSTVARYAPVRLTMVEPSLEDVYIRLMGARGMRT